MSEHYKKPVVNSWSSAMLNGIRKKNEQIVNSFISSFADIVESQHPLLIHLSDFGVLSLESTQAKVSGHEWFDSVPQKTQYDLILADLPLGMGREKYQVGGKEISLRKNWCELTKALRLLDDKGVCLALVEPTAFGAAEGPKYEEALNHEGYHLNGIFNVPEHLLGTTSFRPVIALISKSQKEGVFVAELDDEVQATRLAHAFVVGKPGSSLGQGLFIKQGTFRGFDRLKAELQLSRLETQYKEYDSIRLDDIADEINIVRHNQNHIDKKNAVYIPMIGSSLVTHDILQVSIKHQNIIQVVLSNKVNSEYLSAFFQSELGKLLLNSLTSGGFIRKINKTDLAEARVALPNIEEQKELVLTHRRLSSLSQAINVFQQDLALKPRGAAAIKVKLESMLDQINLLSDADKVMSLTRNGESKTVEFKQTFSMCIHDFTKNKNLELSALKTVAAFLNSDGGTLLIGISDAGEVIGINEEVRKFYKDSGDKFLLYFKDRIKSRIGEQFYPLINQKWVNVNEKSVLMIECGKASNECYLDGKDFYVRTNPATDKLEGPKLVDYVRNRFKA